MRERVARSRVLVAEGYLVASVARVMQISRQALYRVPKPHAAQPRSWSRTPGRACCGRPPK